MMQHPFQALAYPLPRSTRQIRSRTTRGVAVARENSQQHIEVNGDHGPVSRLIGLTTSRPADFMASASHTATFKLPA
jgi:hypothetical protein